MAAVWKIKRDRELLLAQLNRGSMEPFGRCARGIAFGAFQAATVLIDRRVLIFTEMKNLLLCLIALIHVSCVTLYPRKVEYSFKESYPTAKAELASHHYSLVRNFTIFQDEIKVSVEETVPNREFTVEKIMWAPDGGTISLYTAVLTPEARGSRLVVSEAKGPRMHYDGPRYITGDKLGPMEPLDTWLASTFTIKERTVGEDRSGPPLYKGLD